MKRIYGRTMILMVLTAALANTTAIAQEKDDHKIHIKIHKKVDGEIKKIDTIIDFPNDSLRAFWYSFDHEKMDSIRKEIHREMRVVQKEHMHRIREEMERVREEMHKMRPEMEALRDSMRRHRIEVIMPKLEKLDSLRKHDFEFRIKKMDSLQRRMIIRVDSLGEYDFDIDVEINLDSILEQTHRSLQNLESLDLTGHIRELDLEKHLRHGMRHAYRFFPGDEGEDSDRQGAELEYKDGKVMQIKTDRGGQVEKVIILSPDGETLDIKEGKEARDFMTRDGERVSISQVKE